MGCTQSNQESSIDEPQVIAEIADNSKKSAKAELLKKPSDDISVQSHELDSPRVYERKLAKK